MSTFRKFGSRLTYLASFALEKIAGSSGGARSGGYFGRLVRGFGGGFLKRMGFTTKLVGQSAGGIARRSAARRLPPSPSSASSWARTFWRRVGAGGRSARLTNFRAFTMGPWFRHHHNHRNGFGLSAALAGFALQSGGVGDSAFMRQVRDLFERHCRRRTATAEEEWPKTLDGYDIGYWIAQGCNGVIYEARLIQEQRKGDHHHEPYYNGDSEGTDALSSPAAACGDHDDQASSSSTAADYTSADYLGWLRRKSQYPLAIKLCFNLEYTNNPDRVLRAMDRERELVPATARDIRGLMKWTRPLPSAHPNIVDLKTAFVDTVRPLPLAEEKWGAALSLAMGGQSLYIVMKRYSMTLRQYILLHKYTYRTARILFGQLLEALAYLSSCRIAHRDMKSNNILVDFDHWDEPPRLVLADFGSCLSSNNNNNNADEGDMRMMRLAYPDETVDLGGNYALRAPEVVCAVAGPSCYVDYSKADIWAAGTLAYEIFTRDNPFYYPPPVGLSNITYAEGDLQPLPDHVPLAIRRLLADLLKRDPDLRPSASVAANVVALSLFRLEFLTAFLHEKKSSTKNFLFNSNGDRDLTNGGELKLVESLLDWRLTLADITGLYAAETILASCSKLTLQVGEGHQWRGRQSPAEEQVRMTFLRRLDSESLGEALKYFVMED